MHPPASGRHGTPGSVFQMREDATLHPRYTVVNHCSGGSPGATGGASILRPMNYSKRLGRVVAAVLAAPAFAAAQTPPAAPTPTPPAAPAAPSAPDTDAHYALGPDSLPREGVPKGEVRGPFVIPSQAYPGTQ